LIIRIIKFKHFLPLSLSGICAALLLLSNFAYSAEQKASREEGQFSILVSGKEIGREKFSIQSSGDSVSSNSTSNFRDPGNRRDVKMETELTMDERLVPRSYQLRTDIGGQKVSLQGTYTSGEAAYQYLTGGIPGKSRFLVGDRYSMLDNNVFHHFIIIARLFNFESKEKSQSFEVVIPQEMEKGVLKVSDMGVEKISIRGKDRELHHLMADSGTVKIDLWVDDQRILYKVALPAKRIEVIRN